MHVLNDRFFFGGNFAVVHGNEEGLDQSDMPSQFSDPCRWSLFLELEVRCELNPVNEFHLPDSLQ